MPSIADQKKDLQDIIIRRTDRHLTEHPELAHSAAMEAVRGLAARLTLWELKVWNRIQGVYMDGQWKP